MVQMIQQGVNEVKLFVLTRDPFHTKSFVCCGAVIVRIYVHINFPVISAITIFIMFSL